MYLLTDYNHYELKQLKKSCKHNKIKYFKNQKNLN